MGLLAGALAALVYRNALDAPFVFDDVSTVLLNPTLAGPFNLPAVLLHNLARPVVNLSFAVDRAIWGLSSFGFHVTNAVLHVIVVGLFYGWCTRVLSDRSRRAAGPSPEWPAFVAAAIFAVHPAMSGTVNYVSARSEMLCAIGFLGALTYARRAILKGDRIAGVLAVALGALALGSSSSAGVLPLLVLAYDAWVLRDKGWRRRAIWIYWPAAVAIAVAAALRVPALLAAPRVPPRGLVVNLLTEVVIACRYLALLIVPRGFALVHDPRWLTSFFQPALLLVVLFASACVYVFRKRDEWPIVAFGVAWFVGVLAPTMLVPVRDGMAEHRLYLASGGLLLAGAYAVARPLANARVARIVAAGIIGLLALRTHYVRNVVWLDAMRLWEESVARSPNAWQARLGHAELLRDVGQCDAARLEYREVLRLFPEYPARAALDGCR